MRASAVAHIESTATTSSRSWSATRESRKQEVARRENQRRRACDPGADGPEWAPGPETRAGAEQTASANAEKVYKKGPNP